MRRLMTFSLVSVSLALIAACDRAPTPVQTTPESVSIEQRSVDVPIATASQSGEPTAIAVSDTSVDTAAAETSDTAAAETSDTVAAETGDTAAAATSDSDTATAETDETAPVTSAGSALSSIFSPARAPQRKTMGLLQRSFLDIAAQGDQELEVAIVIDGTKSMKTELASIRKSIPVMLNDLRKFRKNEVRAAVVIYRDSGSPSGEVFIAQQRFTADEASIDKALESLVPEDGAPFFHELPDLGIHTAINELPWTLDDQVAKWILMFGDAPPYAESRSEAASEFGYRRFGTDILVGAAKAKGIRINCMLCTSSDDNVQAYEKSINETRAFMTKLSSGTDGLMLDLSYPDVSNALIEAAKQPEVQYAEIMPITAIDLASVRRDDINPAGSDASTVKHVSVAVLPHMPLDQIRSLGIDPSNKAVQVSTALRTRLSQIAGVEVASPVDIQKQMRRARAGNASPQQALRGLAGQLGVDYVVWGQETQTRASYQTAAYRRDNGQKIVEVDLPGDADQGTWAHIFLTAASTQAGNEDGLGQLLQRIDSSERLKDALKAPMAKSASTSGELLEALEALDQALAYDTRSDQSAELLEKADRASKSAAVAEPRNPLPHWLQANVAYNQAAHLFQIGETESAKERMQQMKSALNRARNMRSGILIPSLLTEVEGDYFLLVAKDMPEAIKRYQALTEPDQPLQSQLRGHWMLSGMYAGDWGNAGEPTVDRDKARTHVMQIMANWPKSPQATLLKQWLKYDDATKKTEFNYLPMVNVELSGT